MYKTRNYSKFRSFVKLLEIKLKERWGGNAAAITLSPSGGAACQSVKAASCRPGHDAKQRSTYCTKYQRICCCDLSQS